MNILDILGNIGFDWRVALANLVNFTIIFFVLKRFAFGPIQKILNERSAKVAKGIEDAERAEAALMMAGEERENILRTAKKTANEIVARGHEEETAIVGAAKTIAQEEGETILREARSRADEHRRTSDKEVRIHAVDVTLAALEKVLRTKIDRAADTRLVETALREL